MEYSGLFRAVGHKSSPLSNSSFSDGKQRVWTGEIKRKSLALLLAIIKSAVKLVTDHSLVSGLRL